MRPQNAGALAVTPYLVDDLLKHVPRRFVGEKIDGKRVLGPNGFAYPVGADGPLVDAARGPVIVGARLSEMLLKELQGLVLNVEPGLDTELGHLSRRRRPDAVKLPDGQRLNEGWAHLRRDHEQPIRLAVIGGEFREELVVGHSC